MTLILRGGLLCQLLTTKHGVKVVMLAVHIGVKLAQYCYVGMPQRAYIHLEFYQKGLLSTIILSWLYSLCCASQALQADHRNIDNADTLVLFMYTCCSICISAVAAVLGAAYWQVDHSVTVNPVSHPSSLGMFL